MFERSFTCYASTIVVAFPLSTRSSSAGAAARIPTIWFTASLTIAQCHAGETLASSVEDLSVWTSSSTRLDSQGTCSMVFTKPLVQWNVLYERAGCVCWVSFSIHMGQRHRREWMICALMLTLGQTLWSLIAISEDLKDALWLLSTPKTVGAGGVRPCCIFRLLIVEEWV